ncbi:uncharacterized protein KY384_005913 [Bacidia gigantensis]|uniref:uncharacterized protein n=1 Tax=Bacidia gigantensis TaxID=2732470 RepID=UPI001D037ACB|nr:uncharacterized protein KY384_005913 [Bacidia gigantensis]KAG8529278.1 hypothetical protein KY384_005913 [Bacidia gigantensis]
MEKSLGYAVLARVKAAPKKEHCCLHLSRQAKRGLQDVSITRTGRPIIRIQGGRSALGGHTATVFGATGFLGRNFSLEDVHVEGAERIAEAVAKYDIDRFIHVSSYNANKNSPSEFFRTKACGEEIVIDVGSALSQMLEDDSTASETYELYGPSNYSMAEIAEIIDSEIYKRRRHLNVPKRILQPVAKFLNQAIWWPTTSADEVEREFLDQEIDPKAKTLVDLNITAGELRNYTFHYLQAYRSSAFYDLPPATEREKREDKRFLHVIDDQ